MELSRSAVTHLAKEYSLSPTQVKVLFVLFHSRKELSYTEIAKAAGVAYSGLTAVLAIHGDDGQANTYKVHNNSLESKGLVNQFEAQEESQGRSPFVWGLSVRGRVFVRSLKQETINLEERRRRAKEPPKPSPLSLGQNVTA